MKLSRQSARVLANFGASLAVTPIGEGASTKAVNPGNKADAVDSSQVDAESAAARADSRATAHADKHNAEHTGEQVGEQESEQKVEHAVPLKKLPLLVAGDVVELERDEQLGSCRIVTLQKRQSVLERSDGPRGMKAMAANLTHLAIVSAAPPGIDTLLIDQFCLAAHRAGIDAIIVINKADLLEGSDEDDARDILATYGAMGYDTAFVNAKSEGGIDALQAALAGRAVTFVGASGVGKSSIIGALLPDLGVRTGEISAATGQGSHTTTVTCWYEFEHLNEQGESGALIDSPGVRQYSVAHLEPADVRAGYRDIRDAAQECRFANCAHRVEPGCHVQAMVESGEIAGWRYENYCKLLDSE